MTAVRQPFLCAVVVLTLGIAALDSGARAAQADQVTIKDFAFTPKQITVTPGSTVTWLNQDQEVHQVTSKTKLFRSAPLDTKDTYSFTFKDAGTFDYFCSLHPQMTGTVVVK